jgi:MFS family permease
MRLDSLSPRERWRNYTLGVINGAAASTAEVFIDSETVLIWFLAQLDVSNFLLGLVTPIRMGGSFLPQILASGYLQRKPYRLPFYRVVSAFRCTLLFCLVLVVTLVPPYSSWIVTAFFIILIIYGLGSGLIAIPFVDIVGKVIPSTQRGTFFSRRLFWGGILGLGASSLVGYVLSEPGGLRFPVNVALLFLLAFVAYMFAALAWSFVKETPSTVDPVRASLTEQFRRGMGLLRDDAAYRTMIVVRLAWTLAQASGPFYVVYAKAVLGIPAQMVGLYLAVRTASTILSNLIWGRISHRRGNWRMMQIATVIGLSMPVSVLFIGLLAVKMPHTLFWLSRLFTVVFVASGAFITSSMIGGMGCLLDIAPPAERPLYIGVTNTVWGIALFVSSLGGLIVDWAGFAVLMVVSACFYSLALVFCFMVVEPV